MKWPSRLVMGALCLACWAAFGQDESPFEVEPHETADGPTPHVFVHRAMGTEFTFTIYPREGDAGRNDLAPIAEEAFTAIDALEQDISSWIPESNTSEINRDAYERPVKLRPTTFELLEFCFKAHEDTSGAFDVTVGPLVQVWREATKEGREPRPEVIKTALKRVGMNKVRLDREKRTVRFTHPGVRLDFGGVGKGLALDKAARIMRFYGVESALLSGGDSSMLAIDSPPGRPYWRIGVHNPYNSAERLGRVSLRDEALSTSACYHVHGGSVEDRPCGIFDPRTGIGVTGMVSVTVVAPTGMETDALSTSFYVMGMDKIRRYCSTHPDIRAIVVEAPEDGVPKPVTIGHADKESTSWGSEQ